MLFSTWKRHYCAQRASGASLGRLSAPLHFSSRPLKGLLERFWSDQSVHFVWYLHGFLTASIFVAFCAFTPLCNPASTQQICRKRFGDSFFNKFHVFVRHQKPCKMTPQRRALMPSRGLWDHSQACPERFESFQCTLALLQSPLAGPSGATRVFILHGIYMVFSLSVFSMPFVCLLHCATLRVHSKSVEDLLEITFS